MVEEGRDRKGDLNLDSNRGLSSIGGIDHLTVDLLYILDIILVFWRRNLVKTCNVFLLFDPKIFRIY